MDAKKNIRSKEDRKGLRKFLDYAFEHSITSGLFSCPYLECKYSLCMTRNEAEIHFTIYELLKGYIHRVAHEEFVQSCATSSNSHERPNGVSNVVDDMHGLVHDAFGIPQNDHSMVDRMDCEEQVPNAEPKKFCKLIDES